MGLATHIPPPRFLYLELNLRCNLKCEHCHFWQREDDFSKYPSFAWREMLLKTFQQMNPKGTLVTCGGEQMLDQENYFHATRTAQELGLGCFSVVNGTRVTNHTAARMMVEGPSEITVSMDSPYPELHDTYRGVTGSWQAALNAMHKLVDARNLSRSNRKLYAMTIVSERNYRDLDAFYNLILNVVKLDKLKLNIVQPTFGIKPHQSDDFYQREIPKDPEHVGSVIQQCSRRYGLNINPEWIDQVVMYFLSVRKHNEGLAGWQAARGTTAHICNTYERNMMVGLDRSVRLCFSHAFPAGTLEDPTDLPKFWYEDADKWRPAMRKCNRYCGISHSVRRLPCTTQT